MWWVILISQGFGYFKDLYTLENRYNYIFGVLSTALSLPDKHTYHHGFYVCSNCHPVLVKGGGVMKKNFYMASSANGLHELNPVL